MIGTQPRLFLCSKCEHRFSEELLVHVVISVFVAHLKSLRCPECGADWRNLGIDIAAERAEIAAQREAPTPS